jgi:hypothetical protein
MAATNNVPTGTTRRSPINTSIMLGGIKMPRVPEAAMVPVASAGEYLRWSITGKASSVSITTVAPTIPVVAAMIVPISVTESARPPGTRRNNTCRQRSRSSPIPLRSNTSP